jgi:oligopeptide/dipeptide ABC transporter ATP-binding protein
VTLQAQILRLIQALQREVGTAVMLISHDIGVIGSLASRIAVYYAGKVVEDGTAEQVLRTPVHPYTQALLNALPRVGQKTLESIPGQPPDLTNLPPGCSFAPRCKFRFDPCGEEPSLLPLPEGHGAACWLAHPEHRRIMAPSA